MDERTEQMQQLFLSLVGVVFLRCQTLEALLRGVAEWSAPYQVGWSSEELLSYSIHDRATLGDLKLELLQILAADEELKKMLDEVVRKRNEFVHSYLDGKERDLENFEKLQEHSFALIELYGEIQDMCALLQAFQNKHFSETLSAQLYDALFHRTHNARFASLIERWAPEVPRLFGLLTSPDPPTLQPARSSASFSHQPFFPPPPKVSY